MAPAGPPFDKPNADTIIRSSDGVEFRVRRSILEEASEVFEDMFTVPQGVQNASRDRKLQEVDVTEDGITVDRLLRLCYPVTPPIFDSVHLVGSVLDAAKKYMMEHASSVMEGQLSAMTASHPLEVFAIAARHQLESEAQGTRTHIQAKLDAGDTTAPVASLKTVRAIPLFRLLSVDTDGTHRNLFDQQTREPTPVDDVDCLDSPPAYPFDRTSISDAALRSSDGLLFHVHTQVLYFAAPNLYERIVGSSDDLPNHDVDPARHIRLLEVPEKSGILFNLLCLCYPIDIDARPLYSYVQKLLPPARKYGMQAALTKLRAALVTFVDNADADEDLEFAGYALACANGLENEARYAARQYLRRNENFEHTWKIERFMENLSAAAYFRLLQYRRTCSRLAFSLAGEDLHPMAREGGYIWNACVLCECDDSRRPLTSDAPRLWFANFMHETALALKRWPCGSTVLNDKRFNDAVRGASSCSNCGRWATAHLKAFITRFAAHVDAALYAVSLNSTPPPVLYGLLDTHWIAQVPLEVN
ncbi:hypothetical protein CERSUDRAFT_93286 [Gelatoporia subvermispora B]|uniref:BTB domain-containing protein n=1 Tax=Ceriporiopsis subvermispora (strain B) TaxID=914234 RepID=M2RL91_CERS8|nr:hypothetical protein CERSUDRAFT_93286 [Gelatoporia subvermispora B]